jgi:hypothetical protein
MGYDDKPKPPPELTSAIKDLITSGNAVATAFGIAACLWWITNLFPYDLSGRGHTPLERASEFRQRVDEAVRDCTSAITTKQYRDALKVCTLPNSEKEVTVYNSLATLDTLKERIAVVQALNPPTFLRALTLRPSDCVQNIQNWYHNYFDKCNRQREEVLGKVNETLTRARFIVAGLTIENLSPRWHPLCLISGLFFGALWIGSKRRRIFALLFDYRESLRGENSEKEGSEQEHHANPAPILLTFPWWIWPIPRWIDPEYDLRVVITTKHQYRICRNTMLLVLAVISLMYLSALLLQQHLSQLQFTEQGLLLAKLDTGFSLTGKIIGCGSDFHGPIGKKRASSNVNPSKISQPPCRSVAADLAILGAVLAAGVVAFLWVLPPKGS